MNCKLNLKKLDVMNQYMVYSPAENDAKKRGFSQEKDTFSPSSHT